MGSMPEYASDLPEGSWDSHCHVVDEETFPLHPTHPYRPKKADLDDLQRFEAKLGVTNVCLIAFSVYYTDNSSIVDALTRLKGRGRAVVCVDPENVSDDELRKLHRLGARGVRLNLKSREQKLELEDFERILHVHADRIRPLGWALQIFCALEQLDLIAHILPALGVPIILDHLGSPDDCRGPGRQQPGYVAFIELLKTGKVWTKLSGTYRFPNLPDVDDYVLEVLRIAPDRVVWASDWPHSAGIHANPEGDRTATQEFRKVDDRAWVKRCKQWCLVNGKELGDDLIRKVFRDNARILWQCDKK